MRQAMTCTQVGMKMAAASWEKECSRTLESAGLAEGQVCGPESSHAGLT